MEPYKTLEEMAAHFGVCTETVARWRRAGMRALPIGLEYRYQVSVAETWLQERAVARRGAVGQAAVVQLPERRTA